MVVMRDQGQYMVNQMVNTNFSRMEWTINTREQG
jgi:hypothetical protein